MEPILIFKYCPYDRLIQHVRHEEGGPRHLRHTPPSHRQCTTTQFDVVTGRGGGSRPLTSWEIQSVRVVGRVGGQVRACVHLAYHVTSVYTTSGDTSHVSA